MTHNQTHKHTAALIIVVLIPLIISLFVPGIDVGMKPNRIRVVIIFVFDTTIKSKDVCVCHVYTGHFPIDGSASYFTQSYR